MQIVPIDKVKPGDILGKSVLDESGQVLLQAGVELRASYIQSLQLRGFGWLFLRDATDPIHVEPDEDLKPETRSNALQTLRNVYNAIEKETQALRHASHAEIQRAFGGDSLRTLLGSSGPLAHIKRVVNAILDDVLNRATLAGLTSIKCTDSALHEHSIDVCVAAILIGAHIGLPPNRLRQLAAGALLHDIGMIFIDKDLPEETRIRQHTELGYELLRNTQDRDILSPHVAYEHHEHQDGTGLPRGLVGSNSIARKASTDTPIPTLIGEIAAVANAYDVLLSGNETHPPMSPDRTVAQIRAGAGSRYNREVVRAFLRVVPVYPRSTEVIVTSGTYLGYTGIVIQVNIAQMDRPVIALCRDKDGAAIRPIRINLADHSDVRVRAQWAV